VHRQVYVVCKLRSCCRGDEPGISLTLEQLSDHADEGWRATNCPVNYA
jgi:hypothetical protein